MKRDQFVRTKIKLAEILAISRSSLDEFLSRPGAPQRHDKGWILPDVVEHIAKCASKDQTLSGVDESYRGWKLEELRQKCRRLKVKADLETGVVISKEKVCAVIQEIFVPLRSELRQLLENELPAKLEGQDLASIRGELKRAFDLIMAAHQRFATHWED